MQYRLLGETGLEISTLSFGASSLGAEFRNIDISEALSSVRVALDCGMNFIDTSPYYGRGMSEVLLGQVLPQVPRESYFLGSKLGRYAPTHFDFSARRVVESVDLSLERMKVDYLDVILCHDVEFMELDQILQETLPALEKIRTQGKVRFIGVSGYPMKMFRYFLERADLDVILSYNHYTLQNNMLMELVAECERHGVGVMNAAPFSARLLSNAPLPAWHKAPDWVREVAARAAKHVADQGSDIARLALQYALVPEALTTCVTGSANPDRVREWCRWAEEPIDEQLLKETLDLLEPIHNWFYVEGRPENNDPLPARYLPTGVAPGEAQ
ncbi:MAG: aldo/keto reductase [Pirellulales bacterium]|nr:aldo/keto reductase [Pirellulales bacterium]